MESTFTFISQEKEAAIMRPRDSLKQYLGKIYQERSYSLNNFYSTDTHEKGFNDLLKQIKTNKVFDSDFIQNQLVARPEFNVQPLIIGSKSDLTYGVRWPNTLEEYFTTFHQNMEMVRMLLLKDSGLDTSLLSEKAENMVKALEANIENMTFSGIVADDHGHVEANFVVSLRQHSSALKIAYENGRIDEQGIDFTLSAFGGNEHDRWIKVEEAIRLLTNIPELGVSMSSTPKIDHHKPLGVEMTINISPHTSEESKTKIYEFITWILTVATMGDCSPKEIISKLQDLFSLDPNRFTPDTFQHTLLLSGECMRKQLEQIDQIQRESVSTAPPTNNLPSHINNIVAFAKHFLKEFASRKIDISLKTQETCFYREASNGRHDLTPCLTPFYVFLELLDKHAVNKEDLQDVFDDPEVKTHFSEQLKVLEEAANEYQGEEVTTIREGFSEEYSKFRERLQQS